MNAFYFSISVLLLFIIKPHQVASFNLDTQHPILARGDPGTYYGYSLAFYEDGKVRRLLIGAPKKKAEHNQSLGAVYHCDGKGNKFSCGVIFPLLPTGDDMQWLGAAVLSTKGTILACAPLSKKNKGLCFYSTGTLKQMQPYSPQDDLLLCTFGFSAALSQQASRFYTGAPSCDRNIGRLLMTTNTNETNENLVTSDRSYFGYAIATGYVLNDRREGLIVSLGFHSESNFAGKVVIVGLEENSMIVKRSITGYQPGEMFGASLAVSDLNGDGRDDIIVGAPHHSVYSDDGITSESGVVYLYYKNSVGEYRRGSPNEVVLRGKAIAGRFGYSLAALGDINGDDFNDLAIGAPYEGVGNVYIYLGSKKGLDSTPSQVINGRHFTPEIRSFGFAMAAQDFDGNFYSDLAVGAYESDAVVYLPARPVIRLVAELEFHPNNISFERRNCQRSSKDSLPVPRYEMRYCLKYSGKKVPQRIDVQVSIKLDSHRDTNQRLLFKRTTQSEMNQSVKLESEQRKCWDEQVYVKLQSRDMLLPIYVHLMSTLAFNGTTDNYAPIVDVNGANGSTHETLYVSGWQNDQSCSKDLQLIIIRNTDFFTQGSDEQLVIDVEVCNSGQNDLKSAFYLQAPPPISFVMIDKKSETIFCYYFLDADASSLLRCDLTNGLKVGTSAFFRIHYKLKPGELESVITFLASVNGSNSDIPGCLASSYVEENMLVKANANISVLGWSRPEVVILNESESATLSQYFQVRNLGPSDILATEFNITIRSQTDGLGFTGLAVQIVEGSASCQHFASSPSLKLQEIALHCNASRLNSSYGIVTKVSAQLSPNILSKNANGSLFSTGLVSLVVAKVIKLPYDTDEAGIPIVKYRLQSEVTKLVIKKASLSEQWLKASSPWVFATSATVGLGILAAITFGCYKFGFFRRNRVKKQSYTVSVPRVENMVQEEDPLRPMPTEQQ